MKEGIFNFKIRNTMSRILTGIQATGTPHLGNLLGAIIPAIELSKNPENESFLFIANMHSLTQIKDAEVLKQNTYEIAAAWLAFGLDTEKLISIDKVIYLRCVNCRGICLAFSLIKGLL